MLGTDNVLTGSFAAIIGIGITIILFFVVGLPAEMTMTAFEEDTNVFDIDEKWNSYENSSFMMSMLYVAITCPALAGLGVMFLSILKQQRREDVYEQPGGIYK